MTNTPTSVRRDDGLAAIECAALCGVLLDAQIDENNVRTLTRAPQDAPSAMQSALVGIQSSSAPLAHCAPAILAFARAHVGVAGTLLVFCPGEPTDRELASLRNALWPEWHVGALYRSTGTSVVRIALDGKRELAGSTTPAGVVVVARSRAAVFAPDATVTKFDKNARGWNGNPGGPGYAHFRWMRQFVGTFCDPSRAGRILDFGCGAGWVGIEAALVAARTNPAVELCAFDPSPEMVRIATENARESGIRNFSGRTGFGEAPPFGVGSAEARFDLVLSSGVISFSGDTRAWLDGLVATLAPGAQLVIGDIHRDSTGMQRRRREKPLLPVREMNACVREDVRRELEARGLEFEAWCGYQLSRPVPELLHFSATRLRGALDPLLLAWNVRATRREMEQGARSQDRFDSWVMRFEARGR